VKNPSTSAAEKSNDMKLPGNARHPGDPHDSKWGTIRYAIGDWGKTVRLLVLLAVASGPAYLILWLAH
jgi:hypothetical protein